MNLEDVIKERIYLSRETNIVIAGMTCSGKTTLANRIKEMKQDLISLISQDSYFKELEEIPRNRNGFLMDSINAFYGNEFCEDIERLLKINQVHIPNYDIKSNRRINKDILIKKGRINIFEGLHTITLLSSIINPLKVYIDSPVDICLRRRIDRDTNKYGVTKKQVIDNFNVCILPISKTYIEPQKYLADIIVDERGKILCR